MKKKLAVMAVAVMTTLSMLATGCGGAAGSSSDKSSSNSNELTFTWWGNQVRNERTQQVLDMYSKETGVTFDGQFSEYSDYYNKLATAASGHTMPDVLQIDYTQIQQYVDNGLLLDLTPYVQNNTIDLSDCNQDIINSAKINNGLYAICAGESAPAMFYNKSLLDKYGITVKDNMSLDDFEALCKEVNQKTGYKTNLNYGYDQYLSYFLRADNNVLYQKGKLGGSSEEDYTKFFKIYEDGIKEGWHLSAAVFAERTIGSVEQDPMVYGSTPDTMSWCALSWSNQYTAFNKIAQAAGTEIGITTWPSPNPQKSDYLNPSQFFCISKDCKNPEAAAKFINYLTNSTECNDVLLGERGIPVSSKVVAEISPKMSADDQKAIDFVQKVVSPNSSVINPPAPSGSNEVKDLLCQLQEQICYGKISASDAGKQLFSQGNSIMAAKK